MTDSDKPSSKEEAKDVSPDATTSVSGFFAFFYKAILAILARFWHLLPLTKPSVQKEKELNLANFNPDCLQLIFDCLPVSDGFHLGQTCRTLYGHFKQSCRTTTSLSLFKGNRNELQQYKADFGKIQRKEEGELFKGAKQIEIEMPLPTEDQDFEPDQLMSLTYIQKIFANFSNLKYLQLAANFHEDDFARLISELNSLPHLTTLHLAPHFHNIRDDPETNFWYFLGQLKPPALKHLTLSLDGEAFYFEQKSEIHLPNLSKLISFGLFYYQPLSFRTICSLVEKVSLSAPHLVPRKGVRFGCSFHYGSKGSVKALEKKKEEVDQLLPYFTYLEVFTYWSDFPNYYHEVDEPYEEALALLNPFGKRAMRALFRFLPQLVNLKSVFLKLSSLDACADYPAILTALAKLKHLEAITLNYQFNEKVESGFKWPRSALTILPNIRTFSVKYTNEKYTDVIRQFKVPYVFPGLATFACFFTQQSPICTYRRFEGFTSEKKIKHLQKCGRKLTRGLNKLPSTVEKKVSFHLCPGGNYFSSPEKLMVGQPDLTSASMFMSKSEPAFTLSKRGSRYNL